MSDDHLTTEEECPDCKGFDRCDFHEGVRRGRKQIKDGDSTTLDEKFDDAMDRFKTKVDRMADDTCEISGKEVSLYAGLGWGRTMSRLIAIGGGEITQAETEPIDTHVRDLTGGESPTALFVPTASGDAPSYFYAFDSYYGKRLGCETRHLTIADGGADIDRIRPQLDWADLVYIGGGSLPRLLDAWRETDLDRMLNDFWQAGTIIAGLSAGAMCWFTSGLTDAAEGEEYIAVECLDWIPDLACTAHATQERRRVFRASLERGQAGLALEDGAAVEFADDGYRVRSATGRESVYHYRHRKTGIEVSELPEREEFTDVATLR